MLLTEIASLVNISTNNQVSPEMVVILMDNIQKTAFQSNTAAFLQYRQVLTLYPIMTMDSSGYIDLEDADIGKTVGSEDGTVGVLVAFDNEAYEWTIKVTTSTAGNYAVGQVLTVVDGSTGRGQITNNATRAYRGPYPAPTDPACRKVWGITQRLPERFWLDFTSCAGLYWINGILNSNDFLAFWGPIAPFETGLNDDLTNEFTFSFDPSFNTTYRWVYWRNPPTISGLDDSDELIIPEAYHSPYALAICDLAMAFIAREKVDYNSMVDSYLGKWVDDLRAPFRDQKLNENMSQGSQAGGYGFSYGLGDGYYGGGGLI